MLKSIDTKKIGIIKVKYHPKSGSLKKCILTSNLELEPQIFAFRSGKVKYHWVSYMIKTIYSKKKLVLFVYSL